MFHGTTPSAVTHYAAPFDSKTNQTKFAFYAQDQWTLNRADAEPGGALRLPERQRSRRWMSRRERGCRPATSTRSTTSRTGRIGRRGWALNYNLFGNGKTAIKGYVGRYVLFESATGITGAERPGQPYCQQRDTVVGGQWGLHRRRRARLGPLLNSNFGKLVAATTYSPDLLTGNRPYSGRGRCRCRRSLAEASGSAWAISARGTGTSA